MIKLCGINEKPVMCFGARCPHWDDRAPGCQRRKLEVRIRGDPRFVLACLDKVVLDMIVKRYIEVGHMSPFSPLPVEERVSGVAYATQRGTLILDDLSRLEKEEVE